MALPRKTQYRRLKDPTTNPRVLGCRFVSLNDDFWAVDTVHHYYKIRSIEPDRLVRLWLRDKFPPDAYASDFFDVTRYDARGKLKT